MKQFKSDTAYYHEPTRNIIIEKSTWIRAKYSGMFRSYVKNGSFVTKGEILGSISDPFGYFERQVRAPNDGYVLCYDHTPIVNQGTAIIHLTLL